MTRTDEIAARLAGATRGEWQVETEQVGRRSTPVLMVVTRGGSVVCRVGPTHINGVPGDAAFIAAAPSDIAFLLGENARLRAVVKALTATVTRYETILREETAAERELAALLQNTALGDAGRIREAEARLERAYRERDGVQG